ncbi:MAG: transposase [Armatimonadetes bacterium]|nr:transposase [Armatimonadota bacterium]
MRHGRKSASNPFDGHKTAVAVEPDSGLITAVEVQPGNSPDNQHALDLVEATEENTGMQVEKVIGDCAYGDGATRKAFLDNHRELVAKVPTPPANQPFHKVHFKIDLQKSRVTCPAGRQTTDFEYVKSDRDGTKVKRQPP